MNKLFPLIFVPLLMVACGDDNSSSANDDEPSSSSEEAVLSSSTAQETHKTTTATDASSSSEQAKQAASSSSVEEQNPTSSANDNQELSHDYGEGYTFAIPYRYDQDAGIIYQGTYTCNYHADTKTFAWEENLEPTSAKVIKIVGDSMWVGPTSKDIADDPDYYNTENLALSTNHNGILGTWTITDCERKLGQTEIKCTGYIGNMGGIARNLRITEDSVYNTTLIDLNFKGEPYKTNFDLFINRYTEYDIGDLTIDSLIEVNEFKQLSDRKFLIHNQEFTEGGDARFDSTGMNYIRTMSSNGKTCTNIQTLGFITEKLCKEKSEDFLLSARDKSDDRFYYENGPVEGFAVSNNEEYFECVKSLITEETLNYLKKFHRNFN